MSEFDVKRLTIADLIHNVCDYLIQEERDDYEQVFGEGGAQRGDNHIYVHATELRERLLREFETTDWEADL